MNTSKKNDFNQPKSEKIGKTLTIYQQKGVFSYGTDAVLLAAYAAGFMKFSSKKILFDFCSGTGIIGLMLLDKFRNTMLETIAVEINNDACCLSQASAQESGLSERFRVYNTDVKQIKNSFNCDIADFLTVNPPYMTANCGFLCADDYKTVARHEILCNLEDIFKSAFHVLKTGGNMFIVYRPNRLSTLFSAAKAANFEIKQLTFVYTKANSESKLILCRAQKGAKEGLIINKPFIMYDNNGNFTNEYIKVRNEGVMEVE